jgi:hypothetical protein
VKRKYIRISQEDEAWNGTRIYSPLRPYPTTETLPYELFFIPLLISEYRYNLDLRRSLAKYTLNQLEQPTART